MSTASSTSALFVATLEALDGVGKVTARKIASHWDDHFEFQKYPKEQALVRLKGVAKASELVDKLNDIEFVTARLAERKEWIEANFKRQIGLLCFKDSKWPARLEELTELALPNLLFTYGNQDLLNSPSVCLIGRHGISSYCHEKAQDLIRFLLSKDILLSSTIQSGFDVVLNKLSNDRETPKPTIMAASSGLSKTPKEYRSHVSQNVKSGGLFYSHFEPDHGPFDHDMGQVLRFLIGVAPAVVFVDPLQDERQIELMRFAKDQKKAIFFISELEDDPSGSNAQKITDQLSMNWVLASVKSL